MRGKIYVHCLEPADRSARDQAAILREALEGHLGSNGLADDPQRAESIVLVPAIRPMFHWYRGLLLADPVVTRHLSRCFVLERSDGPADYLRGCYASMPAKRYDSSRHRAIGFLRPEKWLPDSAGLQQTKPTLLFSFRGAESHRVRRRIVEELGGRPDGQANLMNRWVNYSESERRDFWRELGAARFILCPRGLGTSSFRVQESMQAGRVPVIVSDDWVPPAGPDWESFSLRVAEDRITEIPALLAERREDAAEMGAVARGEWERYFDPRGAFASWLLTLMDEVADEDPDWTAAAEIERWSSPSFRWSQGFDPLHRVLTRAHREVLQRLGRQYPR